MNFLFVTDNSYNENNAVFNICMTLTRQLVHEGSTVTILGNCEEKNAPRDERVDGIRFVRFHYPLNPITRNLLSLQNDKKAFFTKALRHPVALFLGVLRLITGYNLIEHKYAKSIKRLCEQEDFSAIVSFSAPYYTAIGMARAKAGKAKKLVYMMDPYATHYEMGGMRAMKQEAFVLHRVAAAIVTREIAADVKGTLLERFLPKMHVAEFPCVDLSLPEGQSFTEFDTGKINLIFAGNFYVNLRSPNYILRLMDTVQNPLLHLTIMGHLEGEDKQLVESLLDKKRLTLILPQPPKTAKAAMRAADILVNVGNDLPNMLPSKIYDYISTGRPIVNICQIHNCPSLPRLEKYPYALNLFEREDIGVDAKLVEDFCMENATKQVSKSSLATRYADCTPKAACELLSRLTRSTSDGAI